VAGGFAARGALREQMLGAHDLRNLTEHDGAALIGHPIRDAADRRVRRQA
jgi:hypothetical protein